MPPFTFEQENELKSLIACALHFWRQTIITCTEDYVALIGLLVRIDDALKGAFEMGEGDLIDLNSQVIREEATRLAQRAMRSDLAHNLVTNWERLGDLRMAYAYRDFDRHLTIGVPFFAHPNNRQPVLLPWELIVDGKHVQRSRGPDNKDEPKTLKDVLLAAYSDECPIRFGVLDNPTLHDSPLGEGFEHFSIELPSVLILVGNHPRVHLLTSFETRPRLYTLIEPTGSVDTILKDRSGKLHPCSHLWRSHNARGQLRWTLRLLRRNTEQQPHAPAVEPVVLPLAEAQMGQKSATEQYQSLLNIWRDIKWAEEADDQERISWLIELSEAPTNPTVAPKYPKYPKYQRYVRENGIYSLARQWECEVVSSGPLKLGPAPFSHGIFGTTFLGTHYLVKDLRSLGANYSWLRNPQDWEHSIDTELFRRWSKYDHPNVLPLLGIKLMARNGVGCVFRRTDTQNLREYLDAGLYVDRSKLCAQVASGLEYLHEVGVIHGNLRASNVLVSSTGDAIISDPLVLGNDTLSNLHARIWKAPEIIKGGPPSQASDVYSLGMTILEITTGVPPYAEKSDAIFSGSVFLPPDRPEDTIPTDSKDGNALWGLLLHCWSFGRDPSNRPSVAYVSGVLKLMTQDGLKREAQEERIFQIYKSTFANEESYELSDVDSVSSSSSDSDADRASDPNASSLIAGDQVTSDPESQKMAREIVRRLALHGCENLTDHLHGNSFSQFPLFRGGFGDVYRGSLLGSLRVSIKTPHISLNILEENPEYIKDVAREIHTWSKCDHPHVFHFLGLAVFRGQVGMVAPWMECGSLPSYLRKTMSVDRCKLSTEVCEGVAYLHEIGIVHGDLKGENVLISSEGAAVVSDFGGSLLKNRSLKIVPLEKGLSLTSRWAAPELFEGDGDETLNTRESDIYALGMTILEAISGRLPWYWITREAAIIRQVCSSKNQHKRPEDEIPTNSRDGDKLWSLFTACWSYKPDERPTATAVGDIMRTIMPGGLKGYPPPNLGNRCAFFGCL